MNKRLLASSAAPLLAFALLALLISAFTPAAVALPTAAISLSSPYTQAFDSLASTGTANTWTDDGTLSGWYAARAGGGTFTAYRADAGTSNTGALYSYGITNTAERALGSLSSGTPLTIYYGIRMQNDTAVDVTHFAITYTGEQWRQGGNIAQQKLAFAYQVGSVVTDVMAGTWTEANELDFVSPITNGTAITGPLDGNAVANRVMLADQLTITVPPGQEIMFRWMDINDGGNDHGLAIDDLTIVPLVETTSTDADLSLAKFGPATATAGEAITYTIHLSNTGSATAITTVVTDILPADVAFVSYDTAVVVTFTQPSATELVWELGDVLTDTPEISIQVVGVITTNITNGTVITNTAVAASGSPESNLGNNVRQAATTVSSSVLPDVEVYVQKTTPTAVIFGGEIVSYTIVYGNNGTQTVEATLTDTLPISFTTSDIAFDDSGLNAIDDTNTRSWTATLASGDQFTFTLALTVPTSIANNTRITNTIEITAAGAGNDPLNDLASASSTVYQIVPISVARAGTNLEVFGVEGQVIYVPNTFGTNEWGVQDASGGISVFYSPAPSVALGDRVRLVATRGAFSNQEQLAAPVYYFANLGSGPQVQPLPFTTGQIASGSTEGWLSVITGTVSSLPACTGSYQFNLDDGSGPTVVYIDSDTGVNVCAQGVVNGDRLVVTGFSTQFGTLYEVKPRFPADVKQLFDVTFVYHDLEDAVQPGEDVEIRGDFNGWSGTTMAHDANYTVFSATVTLPTTATQSYKYYVEAAGGNTAWNLLNTNNRSLDITQGTTLQNDYRNVVVGWGNMNGPASQTINLGSPTASIDGQLYVQEVTNPAGAGRSLKAEVGYGNTADPASWSWFAMAYASQTDNNDVYAGVITPTAGGVYSYATRYNGNWGAGNPNSLWIYADLDGIPFSLDQAGVLTVTEPRLALDKTVVTTHDPAELGEVVTYTLTLSNSGDGTATGIVLTDVLPTEVTFGGFAQQNGATFGSGTVSWNGSLNAGAQTQIVFTATVGVNTSYLGQVVTNTVSMTADNATGQAASIAFNIVNPPQLDIVKTVETANAAVGLGEVVTYTLTLSNSGSGPATGVMITDVLPAAVDFGGFVQQNGAVYGSGAITWSGSLNAGAAATVIFTATVKNDPALYGADVLNTVQFTSDNGGSGSANIAFAVVKRYFLYLPLIQR